MKPSVALPTITCRNLKSSEWDEVVHALADEVAGHGVVCPATATTARRVSFSLLELVGLYGAVADEFVGDLFAQADRLVAATANENGFCVPRMYDDEPHDEDEPTRPALPMQLARISGLRRIAAPQSERNGLRLKTG